jgi:uncharacterized protein
MARTATPEHSSYGQEIERHRLEKDEAFKYEDWSPVDPHQRANFPGLSYFPPDERWRLKAKITRLKDGGVFEMPTSTGENRKQLRYARLDFETPEGKASLFAYKDAHGHRDRTLFMPFRDATSGKETYGAGRYLDLEEPDGDEVVLDFNLAYNPYCAYSEAYSCPLPPPENWLSIPVRVGEKNFGSH